MAKPKPIDTDCLAVLEAVDRAFPNWSHVCVSPDEDRNLVRTIVVSEPPHPSNWVEAAVSLRYLRSEGDRPYVLAALGRHMRDELGLS